jgi:hypothetical protein
VEAGAGSSASLQNSSSPLQDKFSLFCYEAGKTRQLGSPWYAFSCISSKFRLFPANSTNFVQKKSSITVQMYSLSGRMCLQCRSLLIFVP